METDDKAIQIILTPAEQEELNRFKETLSKVGKSIKNIGVVGLNVFKAFKEFQDDWKKTITPVVEYVKENKEAFDKLQEWETITGLSMEELNEIPIYKVVDLVNEKLKKAPKKLKKSTYKKHDDFEELIRNISKYVKKPVSLKPIEDILPKQLKISSAMSNKIIKHVIPSLEGDYYNIPELKSDVSGFTGKFTATYKSRNEEVKLEIESLNDINKLVKNNKFNKFYDFMLHCLDRSGLDNGYLTISYKLWLQYTKRKENNRMVKEARAEIRKFMGILKGVSISFKGKKNMGYDSTPFYSCDTEKYSDYVELGIDVKFVEALGKDYYTLPLAAGGLSQRAYNLVTNIMWYCRVNCKESGKPFNIKYKTLCEWSGLPTHEYVKEHHVRNYPNFIYTPMDKSIAEIREILPDNIKFNTYFIPESKSEILKNVNITVDEIDYTNVIKLKEKSQKKNEKSRVKTKAQIKAKA